MAASLSGHRNCPKNNAARGWNRTDVGARRNRRLSPLHQFSTKSIFIKFIYEET